MNKRIITHSGAIFLMSGLPAWAQTGTPASTSSSASAPGAPSVIIIPDPEWFIAGLVTGLLIGVIGAKVFGSSKPKE